MEVSGEVADLMVKEGLQVSETAVKLAGSGIKNVAALLLAPESGEKTRGRLRAKATGVADMAKGKILEGLDAIEAALEEE